MFSKYFTLLLNSSYEPIHIVNWKKAFCLFFQNKVEVLEEYQEVAHTVSKNYPIPAVIRLIKWISPVKVPSLVKFSRRNVYLRDGFICQYCGKHFPENQLTLDHVIPSVLGGKKCWENIVTACKKCNQLKGNRTPVEAHMKLLHHPKRPHLLSFNRMFFNGFPKPWYNYLPLKVS